MTRPSPLARWCLRRLTAPQAARVLEADLDELAGSSRWRLEVTAWAYVWRFAALALSRAWSTTRVVLRDSWRAVTSAPRTSAFTVGILALAITTATVTFSVVDAVVLRPLPFDRDHELVTVELLSGTPTQRVRAAAFEADAWRTRVPQFESLAMARPPGRLALDDSGTASVNTVAASHEVFGVLGIRPFRGRLLTREDEQPGAASVAVVSHGFWMRALGGSDAALERAIGAGPRGLRVVGVLPPGVIYPLGTGAAVDVWTPLAVPEQERHLSGPGVTRMYHVIARLQPTASIDDADAAVKVATADLARLRPEAYRNTTTRVTTVRDAMVGELRPLLLLALWAVIFVTAVACVNVANLALTRASSRRRELALRASLGAGRRPLMAGLLVEGLQLAAVSSAVALGVSVAAVDLVRASLPPDVALTSGIAVNGRVFLFAATAALLTGLGFAIVPAMYALRMDLNSLLREGAPTVAAGPRRWQTMFLSAQVTCLTVLLIAATLMVTSFIRVVRADLGFGRDRVVIAPLSDFAGTVAEAEARFASVPGASAAALLGGGSPPLVSWGSSSTTLVPEGVAAGTSPVQADFKRISPGYFATLQVPILRGRSFDPTSAFGRHVIIDEQAATALFGTVDAVGRVVRLPGVKTPMEILGVVANVRALGPESATGPQAYVPLGSARGTVLVRAEGSPHALARELTSQLERGAPAGLRYQSVEVLSDAFGRLTANRRVAALTMAAFGLLALLIGLAGVYGVVSSQVSMRSREFGVRIALGATSARVQSLVLQGTGRTVLMGVAVGLPLAALLARRYTGVLFRTDPLEPPVYLLVVMALLLVGLLAASVPARRAARVNPIIALKAE